VDLAGLQALCTANYAAIVRLLPQILPQLQNESVPQLVSEPAARFVIDALGSCEVHVRVLECGPYTTLIDIEQVGGIASAAVAPQFQVRVYHDARMAEVVACHGHRHIKPRYDYPNARMYQRDEKYQLNQFLGEYLSLCLATGRTVHGVSAVLN
jgi:hypothetical protein